MKPIDRVLNDKCEYCEPNIFTSRKPYLPYGCNAPKNPISGGYDDHCTRTDSFWCPLLQIGNIASDKEVKEGMMWGFRWGMIIFSFGLLAYVLGFFTIDGSPCLATSPFPPQTIQQQMGDTEHVRYIETVGVSPNGKTIFSYQWVDYGFSNIFTVMDEVKQIEEDLGITDLTR